MEHASERGLTLSLTWNSGIKKKVFELPLGGVFRVAAVLALCALSYQFGVWHSKLEHDATAVVASVAPLSRLEPIAETQIGGGAPGAPAGQPQDVITPLNVRDPSALVMGPGAGEMTPPAVPPAPRKRRDRGDWRDELRQAARP